jgi:hypothetical protein
VNNSSQNNPTFYNSKGNNSDPLSPNANKEKAGQIPNQSTRNQSVINMKKASARFLSPIGGGEGGSIGNDSHSLPPTNISKYPSTLKPENPSIIMQRPIRETKNQQLFDKYMHKHLKGSAEMPISN